MERWLPRRQNARVSTHLTGTIESADRAYPLTIVSLSEAGFFGDGFELDQIVGQFEVEFALEPKGPAWSPVSGAGGWKGAGGEISGQVLVRARAEMLYLDLSDQEQLAGSRVGLGARFTDLEKPALEALREFVSRSVFREQEWRTSGGVPAVPPSVAAQRSASQGNGAE